MKTPLSIVFTLLSTISLCFGENHPDSAKSATVVVIPYQAMMYFSDADPDFARFSQMDEQHVRTAIRNSVESDICKQLSSGFDAVSLMRASSLNAEEDLKKIYASTKYTMYSKPQKASAQKSKTSEEKTGLSNLKGMLNKSSSQSKDKGPSLSVSDSTVMLGLIDNPDMFKYLYQKHHGQYILFITQFEITTDNKNTIEWTKQDYKRTYTLHYNLFDQSGNLVKAEMLTIKASNENNLKDINDKYLMVFAERLKEIISATAK